jgi:hypothetical protein
MLSYEPAEELLASSLHGQQKGDPILYKMFIGCGSPGKQPIVDHA